LHFVSIYIYIVPIVQVFIYEGKSTLGIQLSKKWLIGVAVAELIFLTLCWLFYINEYSDAELNDFFWSISIIHLRGIFLFGPILGMLDSVFSGFALGVLLYIFILIFDYFTLLVASVIRNRIRKSH